MTALRVVPTALADVKLITPVRHRDNRGFFSETYNRRALADVGIDLDFVQDNHAFSAKKGTVRGLHFQTPPHAQVKLVRVMRGAIFDVAVDVRKSSQTFGRHIGVVIDADNWSQILIPVGFAHGFCTLDDDTEVLYKVTDYYAPEHDRGVFWADYALAIAWPIAPETAVVSEKDAELPLLKDFPSAFP